MKPQPKKILALKVISIEVSAVSVPGFFTYPRFISGAFFVSTIGLSISWVDLYCLKTCFQPKKLYIFKEIQNTVKIYWVWPHPRKQ